ncbi:MAG: SPOR domain-containing protein [Rhodothermales bacterium]
MLRNTAVLLLGVCLGLSACIPSREAGKEDAPTSTPSGPVPGFRVQIHLTPDKPEADSYVEEALSWWQNVPASQRPDALAAGDLPVEVAWLQPYYRVRVGAFTARSDAETALTLVRDRFPDALIVPVTLPGEGRMSGGEEERKKEREEEERPDRKRAGGW